MKLKVGTLLEKEVVQRARRPATDEGRPLSDILQDTIPAHLDHGAPPARQRERAYEIFCETPMRIPRDQFLHILGDDARAV